MHVVAMRDGELGHRAPALVTAVGGLMHEATVRPMFAGPRERLVYSKKPTVPVTEAG